MKDLTEFVYLVVAVTVLVVVLVCLFFYGLERQQSKLLDIAERNWQDGIKDLERRIHEKDKVSA